MPTDRRVDRGWLTRAGTAAIVLFAASPAFSQPNARPGVAPSPISAQPTSPFIIRPVASPQIPQPTPLETPQAAFEPAGPPIYTAVAQLPTDLPPPPRVVNAQSPNLAGPFVEGGAPEETSGRTQEIVVPLSLEPYELDVPPIIDKLSTQTPPYVRPRSMATATVLQLERVKEGPPVVSIIASKKGTAEITLTGENGVVVKYRFRWIPSLDELETILLKQFPNSSLKLSQPADNIVIVEGAVDSAAEVDPIMTLLQNFVPRDTGKVINAMQIVGPVQVQLEVLIARVDRSRLRQLGFNFTQSHGPWFSGSQVGNVINTPAIKGAGLFPLPGNAPSVATLGANSNSTLFLGLTQDSSSFGTYLAALEQQDAIKVLARPTLVTMSGRPAEFLNGGEQPYLTVAGVSQNPNVQFKKFGTRLNFVPVVMGQGKIRLDLAPSVSAIDSNQPSQIPGSFLPLVVEQSLHASVEMESGQTLVMGGMYQTSTAAEVKKVPVLGSLPIVGAAFRTVTHTLREQELMVLVTPRLVHPLDPHQVPTCFPGEETRSPTNHELYLHGLPEVENCGEFPPQPRGGAFPAPLQYPQWSPSAPGVPVQNESLPQPLSQFGFNPRGTPPAFPFSPLSGPANTATANSPVMPVSWTTPVPDLGAAPVRTAPPFGR